MPPYALVGEVLAPDPLGRAAVVVGGGRILEIVRWPRPDVLPPDHREVPGFICPGFIELQINGSFGTKVEPVPDALATLARELPKTGTTSFLPTLISSPSRRYAPFLEALKDASRSPGATMLGAHLEGPFLSPARKGAHDPANLVPPDRSLVQEFVRSGVVRMVTLAPELPGATEAIRLFLDGGVVPSTGHTDASYEEVLRAVDAGLLAGTHLYNAMSGMGHRAPGAVGALLVDERTRAGIIADGVHVHEAALGVAYRQKGPRGLAIVTDAMEAAGMPPGRYELGGREVRLEGQAVQLPDGTLAGSTLTMDHAVREAAKMLRIPMHDAVCMATRTPAEMLGMPQKGRIAPGADADLVVLTPRGGVQETIVSGKTVYSTEEEA